ncbi:MAG: hypothetical protein ACKVP3_27125 [Hyphomicrobiaceae bacterium]
MNEKVRIEVDEATAMLLEARAAARGLSVSDLIADLVGGDAPLPAGLTAQRDAGDGPWAADALAEDARRLARFRNTREGVPWAEVKAWMQSWGSEHELPAPKSRKL